MDFLEAKPSWPAATWCGLYNNPPGVVVLRIIDGKLFEDTPLAWEIHSQGQPIPVLLGVGPVEGDFAIAQTYTSPNLDRSYSTVVHRGKYYDNFTQWLYAQCEELDPNFSPRWAVEAKTSG